ncbi:MULTISPECIES: XrtA-associated tyrosine autokinase [Undibacterium]|nr:MULTISPECIES: XrtA-associated tyrosine autokinase [Undibacterium]MCX7217599.1 XrtA-associated tyrosine autokinase [Burkholderiales bacterium]
MSIIEKAAGRLEPNKAAVVPPIDATIVTPVVERKHEIRAEKKAALEELGKTNTRKVEIDIEQLHRLGMVTPDGARTSIAEEFRLIKRPLIEKAFSQKGKPIHHGNLIMVASSLPGEGKTFCAVNLAISMAMELDHTVLLVDADVARPSVPRYLQIRAESEASEIGLMDVLLDDNLDLADAMLKTNIDKLTLLRAGRSHHRATELLASQSMIALLSEIADRYPDRLIIFDSPPLLLTSEARVLASQMGQIVLVVEAESTTQHAVKEVLHQLKACQNVNLIYNKAKTLSNGDYYGRYYG